MDDILLHCMDTFQQFLDVHAFLKKKMKRGGGGVGGGVLTLFSRFQHA